MLYNVKPVVAKFISALKLDMGVVLVLMDPKLSAHYREHDIDYAPSAVGEWAAEDVRNARVSALINREVLHYRYTVRGLHSNMHEASRAELNADASLYFGIGPRGMLFVRVLKARGAIDGVPGFPNTHDIYLIPILNKQGEEKAPEGSELKEGMVVYRAPSFNDEPKIPFDGRTVTRHVVFDKEKSINNVRINDDDITWVHESPVLYRPIVVGQVYEWYKEELNGQLELDGQPFAFSLRNTFGYNNNLWSWRSHGDVTTIPKNHLYRDMRETYLEQLRAGNTEIVMPTEYYYNPEVKKLQLLSHTIV